MPSPPRVYDVVILGAGAAGLMCAAVAAQRGRRVVLLDHNAQPGRKILISGGGRCNFTNIHCTPDRFLSANPHFAKSALALYTPQHFLELVNRYRIPWHEKTLGQLFCDHSSRAILDMLLAECERGRTDIVLNARNIQVDRSSDGYHVSSLAGDFAAHALVIATGGLSIPKLGATGLAYDLARQFGLRIIEPRPALVPLVLGGDEARWTELTGVSTEVVAWSGPAQGRRPAPRFREKMLLTHRGLSGPAILQASSYWRPDEPVHVDLAPALAPGTKLIQPLLRPRARRDETSFRQALRAALPQRLANHLADIAAPAGWSNAALDTAECNLRDWQFHPVGTEGFEKAEVTAGGINTDDLNTRTMEARSVPGIFVIGEAVDVTGHLGGFNFQWAWASAVAAGNAL
ncbi:BaiN/RdsA family NAD(P)/FAD-dependent oxidoreductase [Occallatibacter riparius]|uniref:NAD(P)/FAD-dependent oxidoreductase n=1 Tax=Occallatibacter riparius TaxID=1002689 RepID=A0A9J7BS47_9BACT|nr:NAD(P)/FAD-dependent oxidoreductase [Occallatibacter riparius]UWZ85488.1 NAD(P)/FAD-dependent oxidoreductase [Occallatibacter riparius]